MGFRVTLPVRFADIDAAGIVFYPRYFEMLNAAVEDWFESMGLGFRTMHLERRMGVPTVKLNCEFLAPSLLGDMLEIAILPIEVGRSSCSIAFAVEAAGQVRLRASAILVCMDLDTRTSMPWPVWISQQISAQVAPAP